MEQQAVSFGDAALYERVQHFLSTKQSLRSADSEGAAFRVVFAALAGSKGYNLNLDDSDDDVFGVYVASLESVLSLRRPKESWCSSDPDFAVHEIGKYVEMLGKGNPTVVCPLFTKKLVWWDAEVWDELRALRSVVLNADTLSHYLGLAKSKGVPDDEADEKATSKAHYRVLSVLFEAERISRGEAPRVWWSGEDRELMMQIRRGDKTVADYRKLQQELLASIKRNEVECPLPPHLPRKLLDAAVVRVRLAKRSFQPHASLFSDNASDNAEAARLLAAAQRLLNKHGVPGVVLAVLPSGAASRGATTEVPDYVGVFLSPLTRALSAYDRVSRVNDETGIVTSSKGDTYVRGMALFEAFNACGMLAKGNHRMLEALWTPPDQCYETQAWRAVRTLRQDLVGSTAIEHYLGLSRSCLGKKQFYHAAHLLTAAQRVIDGDEERLIQQQVDSGLKECKDEEDERVVALHAAWKDLTQRKKKSAHYRSNDAAVQKLNQWLLAMRLGDRELP